MEEQTKPSNVKLAAMTAVVAAKGIVGLACVGYMTLTAVELIRGPRQSSNHPKN